MATAPHDIRLEALLFWKAEPMTHKKIAEALGIEVTEVPAVITSLREKLSGRGITLLEFHDEVTLGTANKLSDDVTTWTKEELARDLGKAGLETLAIIIYQGPVSRVDIDYIRGVNSNFILRNLLVRGLVNKIPNPKDQRSFLYEPTLELLAHLGISKLDEMPDLEKVQATIASFKSAPVTPPQPNE